MILELFAFGTFWFWASSFAFFVLLLALSENNKNFFAVLLFIGFAALMYGAGNFKPITLLEHLRSHSSGRKDSAYSRSPATP